MGAKNEVPQIIANSLFLVGAGFSRGAGCLTSGQMFDDLKEKIFSESTEIFSPVQKEALKFLISCLTYHSEWRTMETENNFRFAPNIEELALLIRRVRNRESFLPYPITGNWADKLVQLEIEYSNESESNENLFDRLELTLKELLRDEWVKLSGDGSLGYMNPLMEFLKACSDAEFRLDVFSLNYDTAIEEFFQLEDEIPWRGFSNGRWLDIEPDRENDPNARINLYKLHGSVDWVRLTDMDTWEVHKLNEDENAELLSNIEEKHNPYIVFGHGAKSFSVDPFFSIVHHFNNSLRSNEKRYFFVIGYSFFDPYINNMLFNAISGFKKLIIVNPSFAPSNLFELNERECPQNDPECFYRAIYKDGCNKGDLSDFLREIQKNTFYSELPEFNFLSLSAENIEYIPLTTEEFLEKFFSNKGHLLKQYIDGFEEKRRAEEPF